jgi:hypothetical protein
MKTPIETPEEPLPELYADIIRLAALKKKTKPNPKKLKREIDFALKKCAYEMSLIRDEFSRLSPSVFLKTTKTKRADEDNELRPNPAVVKDLGKLLTMAKNKYKIDHSYIRFDKKNMTQMQKDVGAAYLKLMQAIIGSTRAFLMAINLYQQGLNGEPVYGNTLKRLVMISNDRLNMADKLEIEFGMLMKLMMADK